MVYLFHCIVHEMTNIYKKNKTERKGSCLCATAPFYLKGEGAFEWKRALKGLVKFSTGRKKDEEI